MSTFVKKESLKTSTVMRKHTFIIILFSLVKSTVMAQPEIINLWDAAIPDAIHSQLKEVSKNDQFWEWTENITNPTLVYFPAAKEISNGSAVIICPGGAYKGLALHHEGLMIAEWFNRIGISAFVLKYRLPNDLSMTNKSIGPLQDAQEAIRKVRRNAKKWNINPDKIGIMGFSAGGHLAATLSTHYNEQVYKTTDTVSARPNFSILIYSVITMDSKLTDDWLRNVLLGSNPSSEQIKWFSNELQVTHETPPTFIVHSSNDDSVPTENSINYSLALRKASIPCELHLFETGGHGYGLGKENNPESKWSELCENWLRVNGLIK
jgi:acetyl esterase/lipase